MTEFKETQEPSTGAKTTESQGLILSYSQFNYISPSKC